MQVVSKVIDREKAFDGDNFFDMLRVLHMLFDKELSCRHFIPESSIDSETLLRGL